MTEREKMLSGQLYNPNTPELLELRARVRQLCIDFNRTDEHEQAARANILHSILGSHGPNAFMEPSIRFDYGCNTRVGKNFFANFNCVILDCAPVDIGDNVMFGPNVSLLTPLHSLIADERNMRTSPDGSLYDLEYALPIKIGNSVWLGGGVIVNPGVSIGDNAVIGSGSVVTKDIPPNVVAAGNPCRVIRELPPTEEK